MTYYDSKGTLVEFNRTKTSFEGTNGTVYKSDNGIAYKEYFWNGDTIITQAMFEFLKTINDKHFIKLIERYYQQSKVNDYDRFIKSISDTEPNPDIYHKDTYRIDMYTYYWVEKEYIDILEEHKDYLLDNLNALLKLADFLSSNYVGLSDIKMDNTVCNRNNIVLIDPDMYYFLPPEIVNSKLHEKNRLRILYLVASLCRSLTRHVSYENSDNVTELFGSSIENPEKALHILSKKLRGYKRPVDYLKR